MNATLNYIKDILLSEVAPEAIIIIDHTGSILYVNKAFERLFELTNEETIGHNLSIIQPPDMVNAHLKGLNRYLSTGERKLNWSSTRTRGKKKSGKEFPIEISFSHVKVEQGNFFAAFIRDITEIFDNEEKIKEQNRALVQKNVELDNFTYRISHDLRAPLLSVLGLVNLYKASSQPEDHSVVIGNIEKSVKKLDQFIREVIDISKNDRLDSTLDPIDFNLMLAEIKDELRFLESKVDIQNSIQRPLNYSGDRYRLKIVLSNLLANAIKYHNRNEPSPYVKLSVSQSPKHLIIIVSDNGIGMSPDVQLKIFDMFYRGTNLSEGSGLGLYIVKEMVNKLKGEIQVNSEPGVGSAFALKLPLT